MSLTTYISLTNKLKAFATAHYQIKRIGFDFEEQRDNFFNEQESYPAVFVTLVNTSLDENQNTFSLIVECLDLIQHDRVNINFIVSDCQLILNDIYLYMRDGSDNSVYVSTPPTVDAVNNSELDYCAGGRMGLDIEVDTYSVCAIPMGTIPEPIPNCEDANYVIENLEGDVLASGSIPSGDTETIVIDCAGGICEDANYELTLNDVVVDSGSIPSGDTQVIPIDAYIPACEDATAVLRDTNGDVISTTIIPSGGSEDITAPDGNIEINSVQFDTVLSGGTKNVIVRQSTGATEVGSIQGQYFRIADAVVTLNNSVPTLISTTNVKAEGSATIVAPDATAVIKDSTGLTLKSEAIPSGGSENITVNDSTVNVRKSDSTLISAVAVKAEATEAYNVSDSVVNVNAVKLADVKATDTLNITVVDSTDASVSVTLSGGNKITIPSLPCATPTVRNAALPLPTGQTDVSVSAKQLTSWLVLKENNPFGNTNRFTDTLGGSTYANGIAIDWAHSSDDDEVVMGWFLTPESNTYANLIAGEPYTKASLSGWYVLDIQELFGLLYWGNVTVGHCLNYAPFNYIANSNATRIKTRTNEPSDSLDSMAYLQSDVISPLVKTQTNNTFLRRLFTYAELGL
jgi:VCBS repeat-containing protein